MLKKEPISSIMTKNVITLSTKDNLYEAERLFKKHHIRHIPIVNGSRLLGLLSLSDLQRISFIDAYSKEGTEDTPVYNMLTIEDMMIKNPLSVSPEMTILEVSKLFTSKEFHSFPVVDEDNLVGIITTTDIISYLVHLY